MSICASAAMGRQLNVVNALAQVKRARIGGPARLH